MNEIPKESLEVKEQREQRRKMYGKMLYEDLFEWKEIDLFLPREERTHIEKEAMSLLPEHEKNQLFHYSDLSHEEREKIDGHIRELAHAMHKDDFLERYQQFRDYQRSKFRGNWFHLVRYTIDTVLIDDLLDTGTKAKFEHTLKSIERAIDKLKNRATPLEHEEEFQIKSLFIARLDRLAKQVLKKLYPHMSRKQLEKVLHIE